MLVLSVHYLKQPEMKKLYSLLIVCIVAVATMYAQQQPMPLIPIDKDVRIGKLDNGLSYYIRKNNLPANQANFYIVQKVGSMQEEESQRGLAHFLEHMAFNGSKNFPNDLQGKGIIPYLETIGVKFGQNLNAGTGFDNTTYNIDAVPTSRQSALDSCLLILHDWSNFLLLRDKDIEKERKIIHEEWRTRSDMNIRLLSAMLSDVYAGSKYANRMPIGLMEVVDNFQPNVLRDYYHKWYRPDLQALVIVGDIDVDATEKKIKEMFADIAKPVNPAERVYFPVPDNQEPIVSIATDKENPSTNILVFFKRDVVPVEQKKGMDYLIMSVMNDMIEQMLSNRLEELKQKEDPSFADAGASNGAYLIAKTKDAMQLEAVGKPGGTNAAIETLIREANRVKEFGFTAGEYDRAKAVYMSNLEKIYNERDKQRNKFYINQYINHFLVNEPIPSIADRYTTIKQVINYIPLENLNQLAKSMITTNNRVVAIMGTDKEVYPTQDDIKSLIKKVDEEKLTAYVDNTINEPLLQTLPIKGKIVKEEKKQDVVVWTLSNGAKVVVNPTNYKDDEILISGYAPGGMSIMDKKYVSEMKLMGRRFASVVGESPFVIGGLGKFSATDLKKVLAGKNVKMSFTIDRYNQEIAGSSNRKDLETAMQLLYLNFTGIRKDPSAYKSFVSRATAVLSNIVSNPMVEFSDSISSSFYLNNPILRFMNAKDVEMADYDTMLNLYRERFANAGDYVFTIVGNTEDATLKALVEQYIGSLPSTGKKATFDKNAMPKRKGIYNNNFVRALQVPKASVALIYSGKLEYNLNNKIQMSAIEQILDIVLTNKIREKLGGTYGIDVMGELGRLPDGNFNVQLIFDTNPDRRVEMVNAIYAVIDELQKNGPTDEDVRKVKEFTLKQHAEDLKRNEYALKVLDNQYRYNVDMKSNYQQYVEQLSTESLKKFAAAIFGQKNRIEVSLSSK
jgi:zinc protease